MNNNDLNEAGLIRAAQTGDRAAFGRLVEAHMKRVYAVAFQMMHNHAEADEVAQKAFVKAFRALPRFKGQSGFFTWMYRITMNVATDHLRARHRAPFSLAEDAPIPAHEDEAARAAERREERSKVWHAIGRLSADLRATVISVYINGLSPKRTAEALGCAEATIHWRLHTARKKLKAILEPAFQEA